MRDMKNKMVWARHQNKSTERCLPVMRDESQDETLNLNTGIQFLYCL